MTRSRSNGSQIGALTKKENTMSVQSTATENFTPAPPAWATVVGDFYSVEDAINDAARLGRTPPVPVGTRTVEHEWNVAQASVILHARQARDGSLSLPRVDLLVDHAADDADQLTELSDILREAAGVMKKVEADR